VNLSATDYNLDLSTTRTIMDSLWHKPTSEALPTYPITQVIKNERDQLIPNGFKTTFIKQSKKNGNNVTLKVT
jgi:hypothetical protein